MIANSAEKKENNGESLRKFSNPIFENLTIHRRERTKEERKISGCRCCCCQSKPLWVCCCRCSCAASAGYLYDALNRLGIKAFLNGDDLHGLFQIIDESRSAIVVLSEDYASAKWCLRELTKIMDSMGTTMDRVLPVFYHIDPSVVKDQSGTFKKSFDEHEANALKEIDDQEKEKRLKELQSWKSAMKKIGNHTGVVITKNRNDLEVSLIFFWMEIRFQNSSPIKAEET